MRLLIFVLAVLGFCLTALAKKQVIKKRTPHYCEVSEPGFSYKFDFKKLKKTDDYVIRHDNDVLRLRICEQLKTSCNKHKGYSICLSKGKSNSEIGIGREPPEVIPEFGKIIFKYTGEQCDDKHNYTVNIKMICDFAIKDGSGMAFAAAMDTNPCEYNIAWRTDVACSAKKVVNCTVDNGSNHYDLSKLINLSDNYKITFNETHSVILNVCHSVLYSRRACGAHNGMCLVNNNAPMGQTNKGLGEPIDDLQFIADGELSLIYKQGPMCPENVPNALPHIQSVIIFTCDLDATDTLPKYVGGQETCNYTFTWRTAQACSEKKLHEKSLEITNNDVCTVKDPVTKHVFNLTSFMNEEFNVTSFASNEIYKFSICSPLGDSICGPEAGACRIHSKVSGGKATTKLMWKESGPYLNYTDGHSCNNNQSRRYTIIEFHCGNRNDYEIEDQDDICSKVIKMSTKLACDEKKRECATAKNEVNLRSLIRLRENYITKVDGANFYMNICKPLVKKNNLSLCNGAGLCKAVITDGKITDVVNLGYPDDSPVLTSADTVTLMYHNGSICKEEKKSRIESRILFSCDPFLSNLAQGQPQFLRYEKCIYFFEWKTNVVCGKVDGIYANNYITNTYGDHLNLSVLAMDKNPVYLVEDRLKTKKYKISFSSNKKYCHGALVCDTNNDINYGTEVSVIWDYSHNLIRLSSTEGSRCSDGTLAQSTITIFCNEESYTDEPLFLRGDNCSVEFEWYTSKICKSQAEPLISTLNSTNVISGGAIIGIIVLIVCALSICYLKDSTRRSHFLDLITCNLTTRNCDRVKYSRVNTVEEVHLLLNTSDPTVIDSDSEDELMEP
ncbi:cation-independent mannose-6-phosphate receptor [Copidosoma floridanum]|uniref:cation-independent mannose-6-phosphate receptor n=1 Tax=Copidosoma floridanum TaxID=29053 RepID=UPI0006C9E0C8|nr:cation-independent mannose-6-phosphate receptor [Copidosoma floridanum]